MDSLGKLREAAISACWQQWTALGASLARKSKHPPSSVVDIEALVLTSLALTEAERRLGDAVDWWATTASRLVSVQRLRTMERRGPQETSQRVEAFAAVARRAGDRRWQHLARADAKLSARSAKGPEQPRLDAPAALMPRLRAAFGVGAKADVLVFLLTVTRPDASARDLAAALDYTPRAVREAAEDMALAGLIEARGDRPRRYRVQRKPWSELLVGGNKLPVWKSWNAIGELVTHLLAWAEGPQSRQRSAYLRGSSIRDVIEAHAARLNGVDGAPQPPPAAGGADLDALMAYVANLAKWIGQVV